MTRDLAYWRTLAASATRGFSADDLDAIARVCVEAETRGEQPSIWHAAATVGGFLSRCPCHPCSKARGEP